MENSFKPFPVFKHSIEKPVKTFLDFKCTIEKYFKLFPVFKHSVEKPVKAFSVFKHSVGEKPVKIFSAKGKSGQYLVFPVEISLGY